MTAAVALALIASASGTGLSPADSERLSGGDEAHLGLTALALGGVDWVDSSAGPGLSAEPAVGADVGYELGRLLFDYTRPAWRRALAVDATYLFTGWTAGTEVVSTSARLHELTLRAQLGYPVADWCLPYLTAGPAMAIESSTVRVEGITQVLSATQYGASYGGGVKLAWALSSRLSLAVGAQALAWRRGYQNDLAVTGGVGLDF